MRTFKCYYFSHNSDVVKTATIVGHTRIDAITEFEKLYPHGALVSMDEISNFQLNGDAANMFNDDQENAFYEGVDCYGNAGVFEDFEQSIGE